MSMINCPECNREISDQARVCPGCGIKIKRLKTNEARDFEKKNRTSILSIAAIAISLLALMISLSTDTTAAEMYEDDYYEDSAFNQYTLPDGQKVICNEDTGECIIVGDNIKQYSNSIADEDEKVESIEEAKESYETENINEEDLKYKDFTITKADGESFTLSDNKGKLVLINFWATWCGYCTEELPDIQKLYKEYKDSDDVKILAINSGEDTNTVHRFIVTNGYDMPVGYDETGSVSNEYGIESLPYSVLIDGTGNIVKIFDGQADYESFKAAIEENR